MAKIFLSYRRQDSAGIAGRIYDRLRAHFGNDAVFMDIDSIPFGVDFREHIDAAVGQCDVFLAVIGMKWTGETDRHRRLDEPRDFVRIELESALKRKLPVIPILIDHARMPGEVELPPSLLGLAFRNAIEVDQGRDFHPHLDRLIRGIEFHFQRAQVPEAVPPIHTTDELPETHSIKVKPRPSMEEKARPSIVIPIGAESQDNPATQIAARPARGPSASGPRTHSDARPPDSNNSLIGLRALPSEAVAWANSPGPLAPEQVEKARPISTQLDGPRPQQSIVSRIWLSMRIPTLLFVLSITVYKFITDVPESSPPGSSVTAKPAAVELTGNTKSPTLSRSGAGEPSDHSATTGSNTKSPTLSRSGAGDLKGVPLKAEIVTLKRPPVQRAATWTNKFGMKFTRIEVGEFRMGVTKDQVDKLMRQFSQGDSKHIGADQLQHGVKISLPFMLGIHEVTQGDYQKVMFNNPSRFDGSDELPVERVTWLDAVEFCNNLSRRERRKPYYEMDGVKVTIAGGNGYRLPTEAEWEYACRAQSTSLFPFGDNAAELAQYAWYVNNAKAETHPVAQKLPNAWGLYDMLGNTWEWCADWYDESYYKSSPTNDPPGPTKGSSRVIRGGSWDLNSWNCCPSFRGISPPDQKGYDIGFRVAANVE
jgi:formylglycine-generating enzyme required for sulfatase activity